VGWNVDAAGGRPVMDETVGRNLRVAGEQVEFVPKGSAGGDITVAGGLVWLRATGIIGIPVALPTALRYGAWLIAGHAA
jgi:hypothetical protein